MALKQVVRWMRSMTRPMPGAGGMEVDVLTTVPPRTVPGARTGVCAFVGAFSHGPTGKAATVASLFEFERDFGGAQGLGEAPQAVSQFFINGGCEALLVRTPSNSHASLDEGLNVLAASRADGFDLLCVPDAAHVADRAVPLYEKALAVCRLHRATLMGAAPREAWFVQCGRQTTTDANIRQGQISVVIGFAPIRPGEFLTFRLALNAAPPPIRC